MINIVYITRNELLLSGSVSQRWRKFDDNDLDLNVFIIDAVAAPAISIDLIKSLSNVIVVVGKAYSNKIFDLISKCRQNNIKVLADINDNLIAVENNLQGKQSEIKNFLENLYRCSDGLLVSTLDLQEYIKSKNFHKKTLVLPDPILKFHPNINRINQKILNLKEKNATGLVICSFYGRGELGGVNILRHSIFRTIQSNLKKLYVCTNQKNLTSDFEREVSRLINIPIEFKDYTEYQADFLFDKVDISFVIHPENEFSIAKTENRILRSLSFGTPVISLNDRYHSLLVQPSIDGIIDNSCDLKFEHIRNNLNVYMRDFSPNSILRNFFGFVSELELSKRKFYFVDYDIYKGNPNVGLVSVSKTNKDANIYFNKDGPVFNKEYTDLLSPIRDHLSNFGAFDEPISSILSWLHHAEEG